jgi:DNA polymerase-3 subunit delta'
MSAKRSAEYEAVPESDRLLDVKHPRENALLFGHAAAERELANAIARGRVHHGLIISGPKGVGKATLAWRFARALLRREGGDRSPDLHMDEGDPVFRSLAAQTHADCIVIRRPWDEKTKKLKAEIPVDEVRRAGAFFGRHAGQGGWRVAIVDAADELSSSAENALLKTLEEPPPRSILILAAHAPGRLLPTIRSRCMMLRLRPLDDRDMRLALDALAPDASTNEREQIIPLAEGSPGRAIEFIGGGALALNAEIARILSRLPALDLGAVYSIADRVSKPQASDQFQLFIHLLQQSFRHKILGGATGNGPAAGGQQKRWMEVSDKTTQAIQAADALNLDKRNLIVSIFMEAEANLTS